jgi:hypothetical protein
MVSSNCSSSGLVKEVWPGGQSPDLRQMFTHKGKALTGSLLGAQTSNQMLLLSLKEQVLSATPTVRHSREGSACCFPFGCLSTSHAFPVLALNIRTCLCVAFLQACASTARTVLISLNHIFNSMCVLYLLNIFKLKYKFQH